MQFDISIRIDTDRPIPEVQAFAAEQFKKISSGFIEETDEHIKVKSIQASFGSINRSDSTVVRTKAAEGGCIVTADVSYNPSLFFWIFIILGLFTYIGWLIPIAFYLIQKSSVKESVESTLKRVRDEFRSAPKIAPPSGDLADLEKLADLRNKGILSEDEFQAKKAQILRLP